VPTPNSPLLLLASDPFGEEWKSCHAYISTQISFLYPSKIQQNSHKKEIKRGNVKQKQVSQNTLHMGTDR
jgi:hypothetical protein